MGGGDAGSHACSSQRGGYGFAYAHGNAAAFFDADSHADAYAYVDIHADPNADANGIAGIACRQPPRRPTPSPYPQWQRPLRGGGCVRFPH
ncbi:MAG: hypothetical protein Fur0021_05660 [Candidatus Promineifilaceae bacterium]